MDSSSASMYPMLYAVSSHTFAPTSGVSAAKAAHSPPEQDNESLCRHCRDAFQREPTCGYQPCTYMNWPYAVFFHTGAPTPGASATEAAHSPHEADVEKLRQRGNDAFQRGTYTRAAVLYNRVGRLSQRLLEILETPCIVCCHDKLGTQPVSEN